MPKQRRDRLLGATRPVGTKQVTVFVPERDGVGGEIDQRAWVIAFLELFGRLFGGGTAFPRGEGVWRDNRNDGRLVFEKTVMIVSFAARGDLERGLPYLRSFLHHFGLKTRQGEVGVAVGGRYYGIQTYDEIQGA